MLFLILATVALLFGIARNLRPFRSAPPPRLGTERVTGVLEVVAEDGSSACVQPGRGDQVCAALRLDKASPPPPEGTKVVAYSVWVPANADVDGTDLVWVAMFAES